jgi:hypothetical protein
MGRDPGEDGIFKKKYRQVNLFPFFERMDQFGL